MPDPATNSGKVAADWERVGVIYRQCATAVGDEEPYLPPEIPAFLAQLIARLSASYYGSHEQLVRDAARTFAKVDNDLDGDRAPRWNELYFDQRFGRLPEYAGSRIGQRRRPTPFEAVVETSRRLRELEVVEQAVSTSTIGAVLGGSASYGRFFNVVGGRDVAEGVNPSTPSDLDLLLVVETLEDLDETFRALASVPFIHPADIALQSVRLRQCLDLSPQLRPDPLVFSGKLRLWDTSTDPLLAEIKVPPQYQLSLHVVERDGFDRLTLKHAARLNMEIIGRTQFMSDFRETAPQRSDHQRNFAGRNLRLDIETIKVNDSHIRQSHIFYIHDDGSYFPGMLQNLILPQFDVRWGETNLRRDVDAFRWKMVERLRFERRARPDEFLRLSLSHTRSQVFAPHAIKSLDQSTLMP